jgi:hypothetical protein
LVLVLSKRWRTGQSLMVNVDCCSSLLVLFQGSFGLGWVQFHPASKALGVFVGFLNPSQERSCLWTVFLVCFLYTLSFEIRELRPSHQRLPNRFLPFPRVFTHRSSSEHPGSAPEPRSARFGRSPRREPFPGSGIRPAWSPGVPGAILY